ncbi:MAG: YDG domain-containing protein [Rhodoferax sp.]|nr:YDG domain-containing protein [Rhodoferax sp.]
MSEGTAGAATKVYDGNTTVSGMSLSATAPDSGDVLVLSGSVVYANMNAGTQVINATAITLTSAMNGTVPVYTACFAL